MLVSTDLYSNLGKWEPDAVKLGKFNDYYKIAPGHASRRISNCKLGKLYAYFLIFLEGRERHSRGLDQKEERH